MNHQEFKLDLNMPTVVSFHDTVLNLMQIGLVNRAAYEINDNGTVSGHVFGKTEHLTRARPAVTGAARATKTAPRGRGRPKKIASKPIMAPKPVAFEWKIANVIAVMLPLLKRDTDYTSDEIRNITLAAIGDGQDKRKRNLVDWAIVDAQNLDCKHRGIPGQGPLIKTPEGLYRLR